MGFLRFLGRHVGAATLGAIGVMLAAIGYWDQAKDILTAFEPWQLQASGALLFVVSVVMILYKWDQEHQTKQEPALPRVDASPPPALVSPPPPLAPKEAPAAPRPAKGNRPYVGDNVTPAFLMGLCEGKTNLHAKRATDVYLGKWIRVSGTVRNVTDQGDNIYVAVNVAGQSGRMEDGTYIWLKFLGDRDRLEVMHKGDPIVADGEIKEIKALNVGLENCELLTSG